MLSIIVMEAVTILLLLAVNGVLAMSELAVVSSRKVRLERLANQGKRGARAALQLLAEPTRFLSTVQVGITLIGILAGAFGGATIAEELGRIFATIPSIAAYADALGLALVVLATTYFSLIIGELVPKRIALQRPEAIAMIMARPLGVLARLATPVVTLLTWSTQTVLRLLRVKTTSEPVVTEDEIRSVIDQGAEAGVLEAEQHDMVEGVLRLGQARVDQFMTPRTDLEWIDLNDPPETMRAELLRIRRSRFLVCRGDIENVKGIVRASELLDQALRGEPLSFPPLLREVLYVPGTTRAVDLLEHFRRSEDRTALVLDEFGGVDGLVTLSDLVEEIVGDLSSDPRSQPLVQREDGSWLADGSIPLGDLVDPVGITLRTSPGISTLGGFVMSELGHVPRTGEQLVWNGIRFEVVDMDGQRIDKVMIHRPPSPTPTT